MFPRTLKAIALLSSHTPSQTHSYLGASRLRLQCIGLQSWTPCRNTAGSESPTYSVWIQSASLHHASCQSILAQITSGGVVPLYPQLPLSGTQQQCRPLCNTQQNCDAVSGGREGGESLPSHTGSKVKACLANVMTCRCSSQQFICLGGKMNTGMQAPICTKGNSILR